MVGVLARHPGGIKPQQKQRAVAKRTGVQLCLSSQTQASLAAPDRDIAKQFAKMKRECVQQTQTKKNRAHRAPDWTPIGDHETDVNSTAEVQMHRNAQLARKDEPENGRGRKTPDADRSKT